MLNRSHKLKTLQEQHLRGILQEVTLNDGLTKIQLSNRLGLSVSSLNELANRLLEQGWIVQDGVRQADRGRKAHILRVNPTFAALLGVDCGRKTTKAVVTDLALNPLALHTTITPFGESQEEILENIVATARKAVEMSGMNPSDILGGGLGLAGQVDERTGRCLNFFSRPEWNNFPVRDYMQEKMELPFLATMWSRAGALGERWFGKAKHVDNMAFVHIGTTISMGMILNGALYVSPSGVSGELGHMTAQHNGPRCYCGNFGCLEAVASESGILDQVRTALDAGTQTRINDYGRKEDFTYEDVVEAAQEGDKIAFQILEQTGEFLGTCVADIINLLSPELVILGGHVFDKASQIIRTVEVTIRKRALDTVTKVVRIECTSFGPDALALGAAACVFDCMVNPDNVFQMDGIRERFPLQGK